MQPRDRGIRQSLSAALTNDIHKSRVLLVGAGGIGCEVLKNLVCCGFGSAQSQEAAQTGADAASRLPGITVVDLDTIDLSNLNRQFLFRKHHIKKPKAFVAKDTASQFNPSVNIDAHHASIFDSQYHVGFFRGFDIVFNALDNLAARRHVNRMCLAANVPLIESGTTGYNGQVQAIKKTVTECYDCNPKPVQTSYPICTIRSTPSQPIHCIVWAKSYLLPELFGEAGEEQASDMAVTSDDNAEEVAKLKEEADALKRIRDMIGQQDFAKAVFDKVFGQDIERLRSMTDMWKTRKPPDPLQFSTFAAANLQETIQKGRELSSQDQSVWSLEDNAAVFLASLDALSSRVLPDKSVIDFDKDDKDTLDFVTSAANLRAHIFGITVTSEWKVKQMAGNIIPAIATSNAMTASLCVLQAFKVLRARNVVQKDEPVTNGVKSASQKKSAAAPLGGCKMTFLTSKNAERMITSEALRPPNPHCAVCSPTYAQIGLPNDSSPTLRELVGLLKTKLAYDEFSATTDAGIIYDPEEDDNLDKPLDTFGIGISSTGFVTITDDSDEPKIDLVLSVSHQPQEQLTLLPEDITLPQKPAKPVPVLTNGHAEATGDPASDVVSGSKRKRKEDEDEKVESVSKKAKANADTDPDEAIVVDDDGTILLEDD